LIYTDISCSLEVEMLYGWEGNQGPGGKQVQPNIRLIIKITCRLTA